MQTFRKKPVEVEAAWWQGSAQAATPIIDWVLQNGGNAGYREDYVNREGELVEGIHVRTLEGTMIAKPGDWIVRGTRGEFYPVKPDAFLDTFEPVR